MTELTEDQKERMKKFYHGHIKKLALISFLYIGWMFFAIATVTLINVLYMRSDQFQFLACFGTALISTLGLQGTVREQNDILIADRKKILES